MLIDGKLLISAILMCMTLLNFSLDDHVGVNLIWYLVLFCFLFKLLLFDLVLSESRQSNS